MPFVSELYGRRLGSSGEQSALIRDAHCPYMGRQCNGGGNRDMARWPARDQPLRPLFSDEVGQLGDGFIPCGVCAVRLSGHANSPAVDWAVCPHRLFSFHSERGSDAQRPLRQRVLDLAGFENGERVEVWSEVALRDAATHVNYRLDYVLMSADRDCAPVIVEVMTASTSGGNIRQGTDIRTAFCNAVLYAHGLAMRLAAHPA